MASNFRMLTQAHVYTNVRTHAHAHTHTYIQIWQSDFSSTFIFYLDKNLSIFRVSKKMGLKLNAVSSLCVTPVSPTRGQKWKGNIVTCV